MFNSYRSNIVFLKIEFRQNLQLRPFGVDRQIVDATRRRPIGQQVVQGDGFNGIAASDSTTGRVMIGLGEGIDRGKLGRYRLVEDQLLSRLCPDTPAVYEAVPVLQQRRII
jgi:hypothetical protein